MPEHVPGRVLLALSLVLLSCLAGCGPGVVPAADAVAKAYSEARLDELREELEAAESTARSDGLEPEAYRQADADLRKGMADSRFPQLAAKDRGEAWSGRAWAAMALRQYPQAIGNFRTAIRTDPDEPWHKLGLAQAHLRTRGYEAATQALVEGLQQDPALRPLFDWMIVQVVEKTEQGSPPTLRLLRFLQKEGWESANWSADGPWRRLALEESRAGNRGAARAAIARLSTPGGVIHVRIDKRFDGLYDPASPAFDVARVAEARIAWLEGQVKAKPKKLRLRVELNRELLLTGRFEKVLALTEATLKATEREDDAGEVEDLEELGSIREQRATALAKLDRDEESDTVYEQAANTPGKDGTNVNQMLDLAAKRCDDGRGKETSELLAKAGTERSPYGEMVYRYLAHCAAYLQKDAAAAEQALAYLRQHQADSPHYIDALLRENRLDAAATAIIFRLRSERLREDMLYRLQRFADDEQEDGDSDPIDARRARVMARKDVQQALDRVGRIESFPSYGF
jgi:hypothetical protein